MNSHHHRNRQNRNSASHRHREGSQSSHSSLSSSNHTHKHKSYRLISDPQIDRLAKEKNYYFFDVESSHFYTEDPRLKSNGSRYVQGQKDFPVPRYKYDKYSHGPKPDRDIFISGLNDNYRESDLENLCSKFGIIHEVKVYYHPVKKTHLGAATISFDKSSPALKALKDLQGKKIMGQYIEIQMDDNGEIAKQYVDKKCESLSATSNGLGSGTNANQNVPRQLDPRNRDQPQQILTPNNSLMQQQTLPQAGGDLALTNQLLSMVQLMITPQQPLLNPPNLLQVVPQMTSDHTYPPQTTSQENLETLKVQKFQAPSLLPSAALFTNLLLQAGNNLSTQSIPDSNAFVQSYSNTTPNIDNNLTPPPPPPVTPPLVPPPPPKSRKCSPHTDTKHKQNKNKQSQYLDKSSIGKENNPKTSKVQAPSSSKSSSRRHSESSPISHASHERGRRAHSPSPRYSHSPPERLSIEKSREKNRSRRHELNSRVSIRERDREKATDRYRRDSYSPHRYSNSSHRERDSYQRVSHASYRTSNYRKSPPLSHASISAPKKSSMHNNHSEMSRPRHHASLKPRSSRRSSPILNRSDVDRGIENISSDDEIDTNKILNKPFDLNENKLVDITPVPTVSGVSDGDDMDISTDEDKPVIEKFTPEKKTKQPINGHPPPPPPPPPLPPNAAQNLQQQVLHQMAALNLMNLLVSSNSTQIANNNYLLCQQLSDAGFLPQQLLYPSNISHTIRPPQPPQPAEQTPSSYLELTAGQISELLSKEVPHGSASQPTIDGWNRRKQLESMHPLPKTCSEDLMNRVFFRLTNELYKVLSRDISRCLIEQTSYKALDKYWTDLREREQANESLTSRNDNEKNLHNLVPKRHFSNSPIRNDVRKSPVQNTTSSSKFRIPILYYGHRRSLAGMNHLKHRDSDKFSCKSRPEKKRDKEKSNRKHKVVKIKDRYMKTADTSNSSSSDNDETYLPKIKPQPKVCNRLISSSPERAGASISKVNHDAIQEENTPMKIYPTDENSLDALVSSSSSSSSFSSRSNSPDDFSIKSELSSGSESEDEHKRSKTKKAKIKLSSKRNNVIANDINHHKFDNTSNDVPSSDTTLQNTSIIEDGESSFIYKKTNNLSSDEGRISPSQPHQESSPVKEEHFEDLLTRIGQAEPAPYFTDKEAFATSDSGSDSEAYLSLSNNSDNLCNLNSRLDEDVQPWFNNDPSLWTRDPAILKKFIPALKPSFPQQSRRFPKRTPWERAKIIDLFLEEGGFDQEDTMMLMYAYIRLKSQNIPLVKNVPWAYHPLKQDVDKKPTQSIDEFGVSLSKKKKYTKSSSQPEYAIRENLTGCSRSEGFYRLSLKEKMLQRGLLGNTERLRGWKENYEVIQTSRDSRATQRRLATDFSLADIPTELAKTNLLHRKKLLCFAKSRIHNWGLFTLEPIACDELVIEYVGESIRSSIGDVREKRYEAVGIGCSYMFRVDSDIIIDATKKGNLARFINHSCDPNCYAKIIPVGTQKRIAIYSKRDIEVNEEITYDYKFPIEDKKIPCYCGAVACRGSLN